MIFSMSFNDVPLRWFELNVLSTNSVPRLILVLVRVLKKSWKKSEDLLLAFLAWQAMVGILVKRPEALL